MQKTLEERLFKNILMAGIVTVFLLILYDLFYTRDYHSVIIELVAGSFFLSYLLTTNNKPLGTGQRYLFSLLLFVFVNLGWISGSGINLLNASLFFLVMAISLILNSKRIYIYVFILLAVNLLVLFVLQYYSDIWIGKKYATEKQFLINDYLTASIFYILGGYIIYFLKSSYDQERNKLHKSNSLLLEKSVEVSYQNEELKMSKDVLDHMVGQLEEQTKELTDIKRTLEEKVNDRTDDLRKLNERLIGQNQQLEQYAYITSHNLRSPIAQIKGLVNLLPEDNHFEPTTREAINRIKSSTENLEKVFADLSEIIRVEKSMQQPWQEVDIIAEVNSVISSLKSSIEKKRIDIIKPVQQSLMVTALRPYVYSVLHNIIENAVKYSDDNKDRRYIKIELQDATEFHQVAITDNGIGIDMELASGKVFKMYQRFNNTHPGQGFGLFLVKSQMEAMEGAVELESILGQGTTFNLYFPKR
jgi:signal transduction histidine kinase